MQEMQEMWVDPWVGKSPLGGKWQPTSVFLLGKNPMDGELGRHGVAELGMTKQASNSV